MCDSVAPGHSCACINVLIKKKESSRHKQFKTSLFLAKQVETSAETQKMKTGFHVLCVLQHGRLLVYTRIWKRGEVIRHLTELLKWILHRFVQIRHTDRVHPVDVGGHAGEDRGLPGSIASHTGHKAGNTMDVVSSINQAVQRTTRVALTGRRMNWLYIKIQCTQIKITQSCLVLLGITFPLKIKFLV